MRFRRHFLSALTAVLTAAAPSAAAPLVSPQTLQCDGTYLPGGNTHTPNPALQVVVTENIGIRSNPGGVYGQMGPIPVAGFPTRELWHFNVQPVVTTTCLAAGCPGGATKCAEYDYKYADPNGSDVLTLGKCFYNNSVSNNACATNDGALASTPPPGLAACPAGFPPLGSTALFPASPLTTTLDLTPSGRFVDVAYTGATWDLDVNYTLSAWFKTTNTTNGATNQRFLSEQSALGFWGFGLNSAGQLRSFDSRDAAFATSDVSLGNNIADNNWHQVHVVRQNGSSRRYYVDGKFVGSVIAVSSSSFASHPLSANPQIGRYIGNTEFFNGQLDDLRVTDYQMTDDDILLEYVGSVHQYSSDGGVSYSSATGSWQGGTPANGAKGTFIYLPGEAVTLGSVANQRWIFEAQSTQTVSSVLGAFSVTIDQSKPIAPSLTGAASSPNDITWSWGSPSRFCAPPGSASVFFNLVDAVSGAVLNPPGNIAYTGATGAVGENVPGATNQLRCRMLTVTDTWGTSPLSSPTTAYTFAATPAAPSVTSISTGGVVVSWGANGNPSWTRYEVNYSPDNFTQSIATAVSIANNFTGTSLGIAGLSAGSTYYVRVRAFNGAATDPYGGIATAFAAVSFVSQPPGPSLAGTPLSNSAVLWSWSPSPGASGYTLYDSNNGLPIFTGSALSVSTSNALSVNTQYAAEIEADPPPPSPASLHGRAFTFTLANPPTAPVVSALYPSSATIAWNANGNPSYTFYQLAVATDPTYGVVVATLTVSSPTATAFNLLPGQSYYARVQAINGVQIPTAFAALAAPFTTPADAKITATQTPATPYVSAAGLVGSWQFEEGAGTTTADYSANANRLSFSCQIGGCASTPTFAGGMPGMGSAASFSGLSGTALSSSGAPFAFNDSLTVEAFVNPQTASQPSGTGIAAIGLLGAEDFALDISASVYRFLSSNNKVAASTSPVVPGAWTHVAGVFDSVAQTATLYVNGRQAGSVGGVPLRTNSGGLLSVGNRMNGVGGYTLPFFGLIDDVRVLHAALTPAQVLAEYNGAFVSTVTPPAPNAKILVGLPPNALGVPAQIYVSADPVNHPIRIPPAALLAGLASTPQGLTMLAGSLTEVVPIISGLPFALPLGSSATVTLPYADADGDGLVDNTTPPLSANAVRMYTLNTTVNRWEALTSSVDRANTRVTGLTPHFSVFALFAPATVASNLSNVKVYPVPWKPGTNTRFDAPGVTFANLPASGSIRVLSIDGRKVRDLGYNGASAGVAVWDGMTDNGKRAASGVYFAKVVSDAEGATVLLKFAIER